MLYTGSKERLEPSRPIAPQIHGILRARIIRNDLTPGSRISESEIAAAYSVSRQPVREAFIRLVGDGLVAILPQRGTIVRKIEYSGVIDARFLREAIEADIVKILAQTPDAALIADLREQLERQRQCDADSRTGFIALDEEFHRTLAAGAGKAGAWAQIEGLKSQMDRVRFLSLVQFPVDRLIEQHADIVNQIESGAIVTADVAIRIHLREVLNDLPKVVEAYPEFFELPVAGISQPVHAPIQGGDTT
ncbi:HTH-type transcriptional repressor RspR [Roseobacter fucihabitans]|uniref:HTH-type transcriptional repressor RspR n=1 Tax=Roseobacter fucihabitans TaxID=1537242 RepID=A0ABZ2C058_9RHOB|nr:GntR family transcriptional regulator [Roseobacter litoralis]MBC6965119.1 putative HTH-type transcriptional regulator YdfH [Roseobacter litoralis]MBC6965878.1 putative HTH-type transcriptional regulator YdfH [Roseobacter litoralis]